MQIVCKHSRRFFASADARSAEHYKGPQKYLSPPDDQCVFISSQFCRKLHCLPPAVEAPHLHEAARQERGAAEARTELKVSSTTRCVGVFSESLLPGVLIPRLRVRISSKFQRILNCVERFRRHNQSKLLGDPPKSFAAILMQTSSFFFFFHAVSCQ